MDYFNGPDAWREFSSKLPAELELHWWNLMSEYEWLDFYTKAERANFIEEIAINEKWADFAKEYGNVFCWQAWAWAKIKDRKMRPYAEIICEKYASPDIY